MLSVTDVCLHLLFLNALSFTTGLKLALRVSLWFLLPPTHLQQFSFRTPHIQTLLSKPADIHPSHIPKPSRVEASASIMSVLVGWQHSRTSSLVTFSILLILNMAYKWCWWIGSRNQICCLWWRSLSQSQRDKNPIYYIIDIQLI